MLPLELCEYGPGELLNMNLYELDKKDFLTTTCKLSGLILGKNVANKSAEETCKKVESLFLRNGPPLKLITDNGTNFTSKKFKALIEKIWCRAH